MVVIDKICIFILATKKEEWLKAKEEWLLKGRMAQGDNNLHLPTAMNVF